MFGLMKAGRLAASATAAFTLAGGLVALSATSASADTLASVRWQVGNNAANATNTNGVTYSWSFVTTKTAILTSITLTVPTGTTLSSSPTVTLYGLSGDGGSAVLAVTGTTVTVTTVTVTLTNTVSIASGTPVQIQIPGFTNGPATGSQTTTVTTLSGPTTPEDTGTGATAFASNTTTLNVIVPDSLTFTNNKSSVTLMPVPGTVSVEQNPATLTVSTNALHGYTLSACAGPLTGPGTAIATGTPATGASAPSAFGAKVAATGAAVPSPWTGATGYQAYAGACDATASPSPIATDAAPTAGDTITVTNAASISAIQAAGAYTGTVNYLVLAGY